MCDPWLGTLDTCIVRGLGLPWKGGEMLMSGYFPFAIES
jgi:hypothetical protein